MKFPEPPLLPAQKNETILGCDKNTIIDPIWAWTHIQELTPVVINGTHFLFGERFSHLTIVLVDWVVFLSCKPNRDKIVSQVITLKQTRWS